MLVYGRKKALTPTLVFYSSSKYLNFIIVSMIVRIKNGKKKEKEARSGGLIRISLIFYNMKVYRVFSLKSPH